MPVDSHRPELMDLVSSYQQLAAEAKRRDVPVRETCEAAIAALQAPSSTALSTLSEITRASEHVLLTPIMLGCQSKNNKVVTLALNALQRLTASPGASSTAPPLGPAALPPVIASLKHVVQNQAVDSQLKILQVLPTLLSSASQHIHQQLLFDILLLCFKLQESKVGVVSSTAAATLRQLVIILFDAVLEEDRRKTTDSTHKVTLGPENITVSLRPCALDAFQVFQDLCHLISSPPTSATHLQLSTLPKTFGLELIESVLSDFPTLFHKDSHPELHHLIKQDLSPLLIRSLAGDATTVPTFSITLRLMRVIFLLLKSFADEMPTECEIFWQMFTKIVNASAPESDDSSHPGLSGTPFTGNTTYSTIFNNVANTSLPWMRVLALEIFRGLCSDFDLLRRAFLKYDLPYLKQTPTSPAAGPTPANTGVVVPLLNAISRLASERPSLLGVGQQVMMGASSGGQEFTVSGMVDAALGGSGQGQAQTAQEFSAETSSIRLQCIDQLDKAESPPLPETYTYLLALQCLSAVAAGFHHSVTPMFNEYATQRCAADQTLSPAAPPPFIAESAENSQLSSSLGLIRDMADATWSSLLYSLSFFISTALSDDLFFQVLAAFQSFTATCGLLNLSTPRDAFIASLSKFALPSVVMASINATPGAPTPGSESNSFASKAGSAAAGVLATGADALGFTSPGQSSNAVLSLSLRNLQCLRSLLQLADQLAGMLGPTWYAICEAVTNSEYALRIRANAKRKPEETQALTAISRLFEGTSTSLDDDSFKAFIKALGKLSCEMIGLPLEAQDQPVSSISETVRKRANSVAPTKMLRANDKSLILSRLGDVAVLNIHRLLYRDPEVAWKVVVSHLLSVQHWAPAPPSQRVQAAQTLDKILDSASSTVLSADKEHQAEIQERLIQALKIQADDMNTVLDVPATSTDIEIRRRAYETLFKLLESNGHSLLCVWTEIFAILKAVCAKRTDTTSARASTLVAASFPSIQLIASDFLSNLNQNELRLCIEALAAFGRQRDDVNIALTAGGLLWQVSDHLQSAKKKVSNDGASKAFNDLWLNLLHHLLYLSEDTRFEVRNGAVQILFRCLESYGSLLLSTDWDNCLWEVVRPLFGRLSETVSVLQNEDAGDPLFDPLKQADESRVLILTSIGSLTSGFLSTKIIYTARFAAFWASLIVQLRASFLHDRDRVATSAMKQFEKLTMAMLDLSNAEHTTARDSALLVAWEGWRGCGEDIQKRMEVGSVSSDISQPSLEAFVRASQPLQTWPSVSESIENSKAVLRILKTVVTWTRSPDYRPDIDAPTPTQAAVLDALDRLSHNIPEVAAAIVSDLAEYSTLPYLATFENQPTMPNSSRQLPVQKITYIALSKAVMPKSLSLFLQHASTVEIFTSGAAEQLLRAYAIPLNLKYECPPSSKFGSDPPLWQTTTIHLLRLARTYVQSLSQLDLDTSLSQSLWRRLITCYSSAISADSSPISKMSKPTQLASEDFDLALLGSLECDILPAMRSAVVPDDTVTALASCLQSASRQYVVSIPGVKLNDSKGAITHTEGANPRFSSDFHTLANEPLQGTSAGIVPSCRERFGYWAFDLLTHICHTSDQGPSELQEGQRRLAALFLPFFLDRCTGSIRAYLADAAIRGKLPFERIRDEELHYIVEKLGQLKLYEGCFRDSIKSDGPVPDFSPLQEALMKSSAAHLFRLLPQLTALLSLSSVTKPTIGVPYRLTKTARQVKGLPEGATLGQIGSSDDGTEVQVITTAEWIRRSLDRASLVVAI